MENFLEILSPKRNTNLTNSYSTEWNPDFFEKLGSLTDGREKISKIDGLRNQDSTLLTFLCGKLV